MSYADIIFCKNCNAILHDGISDEGLEVRPKWPDGTPAHTKKILYVQNQYELTQNYIPVMTLRKSGFRNAIDEILWIYQKQSNRIADLNSHIWDSWDIGDGTIGKAYGYQIGLKSRHHKYHKGEDLSGIRYQCIDDWIYLSQIDAVIWDLKNRPSSRSIMTTTYNPKDLSYMGLRPCAYSMIFNVTVEPTSQGDYHVLNGMLLQRSQDMLTANNWNVIQYATLLQMIAHVTHMKVGRFVHSVADMHIYDRHIPIVKELLDKEDAALPTPIFNMNRSVKSFYDFTVDDFELINYQYLPFNHKIEVAI